MGSRCAVLQPGRPSDDVTTTANQLLQSRINLLKAAFSDMNQELCFNGFADLTIYFFPCVLIAVSLF
jgi:hypothetical protein